MQRYNVNYINHDRKSGDILCFSKYIKEGGNKMKSYEKPIVLKEDHYKASNSSNCPKTGEGICGSQWQKR